MSDTVAIQDVPGVLRDIGITPGRKYLPSELTRLVNKAKAQRLRMQGYVLRMDAEGFVEIVHVAQADDFQSDMRKEWQADRETKRGTLFRAPGRKPRKRDLRNPVDAGTIPSRAAVKKRTPQQRLDSLMQRWVDDCMRAGTVPGLDDVKVSMIVNEAWRTGRTQVTGEHVRRVAQFFLERAEKEKEMANRKLIVTPPHGS